jgi:hypothetical protein
MRVIALAVLVGILAGAATSNADGAIYVHRYTLTGGCSTGCITPYSPGQSISISTTNNDWLIYTYSTLGNEDSGRVTITFSGGGAVVQTLLQAIGVYQSL